MKTLLLTALAILTTYFVCAHDFRLLWDANTDAVSGYRIYAGTNSRQYHMTNDVGTNTTGTFSNLANGIWYFAATAYLLVGTNFLESQYSVEVDVRAYPKAPGGLQLNTVFLVWTNVDRPALQWSHDLLNWRDDAPGNLMALSVLLNKDGASQQFWRLR